MATPRLNKSDGDEPAPDRLSQRRRPETGRFQVRVDRQTKSSYATAELANAAALEIKVRHPVVQVSVFDSEESLTTVVDLPPGSE